MKTPRQLRRDIEDLSRHLQRVQASLESRSGIALANIGRECGRAAEALGELLRGQQLPNQYKVAVVGRFKAGKSSFVNELLGHRLASEDTLPETAAVTTFRHGAEITAQIRFVDKATWNRLKQLHADDPQAPDVHRVRRWQDIATTRRFRDGEPEPLFDLAALEAQYVRETAHTHVLRLSMDAPKKAANEFRRGVKEFTSANSPAHCLVDTIEITAPADILDEGVLLIDTPGLADTERFRVALTEQVVEDVDAVLFLTKSGAAYDQSEKDFLLSLLRKGTVRQLIVVVTQIDETYRKVIEQARDNDEQAETIDRCIARERTKIQREIGDTLRELGNDESVARYREQLGDIPVEFTSAILHRRWREGQTPDFAIDAADPGGVAALKASLLRLLSTESRLSQTADHIVEGARAILLDLQAVLENKLLSMQGTHNREVAQLKLNTFRTEFGQAGARFEGVVEQCVVYAAEAMRERSVYEDSLLDQIALLAAQPLATFEAEDMGRHWKTRRHGGWGYMQGLELRVANAVFPKVQQLLGVQSQHFADYAGRFEQALATLAAESDRIGQALELGASVPLDVSAKLRSALARTLQRAQDVIAAEEQRVLERLDKFVSEEVDERIAGRRQAVAGIWDAGTTHRQAGEIRAFYAEVKALLAQALMDYLRDRHRRFGQFLLKEAKAAPIAVMGDVNRLIEQAADDIVAATTAHIDGQQETARSLLSSLGVEMSDTLRVLLQAETAMRMLSERQGAADTKELSASGDRMAPTVSSAAEPAEVPAPQPEPADAPPASHAAAPDENSAGADWASRIQETATESLARLQLHDGAIGWSYEKAFPSSYLRGAVGMSLVDPYLAQPHQLRNLKEFLLHVAEAARPRDIEIVTLPPAAEQAAHQSKALKDAGEDLFRDFGACLSVRHEAGLHDRHLRLDHGVLFKLGRGLDIYKPAVGLAAHRPASRRVRATEIDVFVTPGHPLRNGDPASEPADARS